MSVTLNPSIIDRSGTATTTSAEILAGNGQRRALLIQNISSVNVGLSTGTAAIGTAGTLTLAAGQSLSFDGPTCPLNALNAIAASGTAAITIWEII